MTPSVLITNHLAENHTYLAQAIKNHESKPYQVTVISSAETKPYLPKWVNLIHNPELNTATKKIQHYMDRTTSSHVLWQSDDVIVSPNIMENMHRAAMLSPVPVIQTPCSNNEEGSRFLSFGQNWLNLKDKTIEEYPSMAMDMTGPPVLFPVEWFAFYCAFIPKEVYDKVGLDEALENRYNDVDFCLRARAIGVASCINLSCFAFHYGTRTLRKTVTPEMYAEADAYWAKKSGAV